MIKRLSAALLIMAASIVCAWAQEPPSQSLALKRAVQLEPAQGMPAGGAQAFSALELIRPGEKTHLAARFGAQGRPVRGRLLREFKQRHWPRLWLFQPRSLPGPWWVSQESIISPEDPAPGREAEVGLMAWGLVPAEAAARLSGPASFHQKRLARLREANLPPGVKLRLLAGRIEKGDNLWRVKLAWGDPQRSVMVNYLSDEQHFIYLRPERPVILRFVGGHLVPPLPK
jgi:hypothetical protein